MNSLPRRDPLAAARQLSDALNGMSERLAEVKQASEERDAELKTYGQQNRHILRRHRIFIWAGIILFLIDIGLTVRVGFVASDANHAAAAARSAAVTASRAATATAQTRASNLAACIATNGARIQNKDLWDYLLSLSRPAPDASPAEKAADGKLLAKLGTHVNKAFKPAACEKLYGRK